MVMDEVIISSPYEPDNCKANASAAATLARVKKVVRLFLPFFHYSFYEEAKILGLLGTDPVLC